MDRFFLDRDCDAHWYIVRAECRTEWEQWINLPEDDEAGWEEPWFAYRVGGNPSNIEFSNWTGA